MPLHCTSDEFRMLWKLLSGADPGIFVRGGGVQLSENFDKQKEKGEKTEGSAGSFSSAEDFPENSLHSKTFR